MRANAQGTGVVNTVGAMNGYRVPAHMKGPLGSFWKVRVPGVMRDGTGATTVRYTFGRASPEALGFFCHPVFLSTLFVVLVAGTRRGRLGDQLGRHTLGRRAPVGPVRARDARLDRPHRREISTWDTAQKNEAMEDVSKEPSGTSALY